MRDDLQAIDEDPHGKERAEREEAHDEQHDENDVGLDVDHSTFKLLRLLVVDLPQYLSLNLRTVSHFFPFLALEVFRAPERDRKIVWLSKVC